ncbi:phosphomannomutase/phosphoglucomutase [Patescibacteria group bacterium]
MKINPDIFRAYDIRGKYPEEINEEVAYKIGRAFVDFLNKKNKSKLKIIVGQDMRLSSPSLSKAIIEGIIKGGADVIDVGLSTTPMTYFGVVAYSFDGGISVTGSHIPKDYNGFKLVREKATPISEKSGIKDIKKLAMEGSFVEKPLGKISKKKILNDYINHSLRFKKEKINNLKIVVDAGNAMGGLILPIFFKKIKCEIIPLYFKLDGSFPNHPPDPLEPKNLIDLQKKMLEVGADLGIALDGDADRVFFIDEKREIIGADFVTALIAKVLLKNNFGEKILYDLRSSLTVKEEIQTNNGIPIISRVGHSFIKEKMRKNNILFGGETSGHYYLRENYFIESTLIVILKVLEIISQEGKPFSEIIQPLKRYFSSGEINFQVKNKEKKINLIREKYKSAKNIYNLDGLSVENEDWWFNVRPSNTENFLRLNLEAKTKELMEEKKKELSALIEK